MAHYRLTARGTLPGETFNFGIHVSGSASDSATAATDFASALTDMWTDGTDGLVSHYTSDVTIVVAHAAEISDLTGRQVDAHEATLSLTGTAVSEMLPHEVAVAITTRGAAANRKNQGRFYLPPPAITTDIGGLFDSTVRGHFAHAAAILVNTLQAASWTPVILHPDFTDSAIVQVEAGSVFDCQRRRRNKLIEVRSIVGV